MPYTTFSDLKNLALKGRSRKIGKILNYAYSLRVNATRNSIELFNRRANEVCLETLSNEQSIVMFKNTSYIPSANLILHGYYGINVKKLQNPEGIKRHNPYCISDKNNTFIYVQNDIILEYGNIISAGNYYEDIIDKNWKHEYTQTSKKNRAAFTALHNIIPIPEFKKPDSWNKYRYNRALNNYAATDIQQVSVVDLVMRTSEPNAKDIEHIRRLLSINSNKINLRTLLQKLVNKHRYDRASKDGKITIKSTPNYPR